MALAQLLGLCPLLAVSTSLVNGLALGLATAAVLVVASTTMSLLRGVLLPAVRVPLYSAAPRRARHGARPADRSRCSTTCTRVLGLFMPLIVVNSGLLAHAETVARHRRPLGSSFVSALATGLGFLFALDGARRAARAASGTARCFAGIEMLGGESARGQRSTCRSTACSWRFCPRERSSAWRCCWRCAIGSPLRAQPMR